MNLNEIRKTFSLRRIQDNTYTLNNLECHASYSQCETSAKYCATQLQAAGFSDVEILSHAADGKSAALDCIMPPAWDLCERSTLRIVEGEMPEYDRLLADTARDPIAALIWSAPTPKGGITGELVDYASLAPGYAGVKGKWVFYLYDEKYPGQPSRFIDAHNQLHAAGAAGIVLTSYRAIDDLPNTSFWFNAQGTVGWYPTAEDVRLPIFSISPIRGWRLQDEIKRGRIVVNGEMNTRLYNGAIRTVTAKIPGESEEEYALFAHLYEPFPADDATGFAVACEIGRQLIERKVRLKKTLRVVFSMELYGYSAFLADSARRSKILAALSLDSFTRLQRKQVFVLRLTPQSNPLFTDWHFADFFRKHLPDIELRQQWGSLSDDTFAGDPSLDIPTNWIYEAAGSQYHHNSGAFFQPDWELLNRVFPVFAGAIESLLTADAMPDYRKHAKNEFQDKAQLIMQDASKNTAVKRWHLDVAYNFAAGRLASLPRFGFPAQSANSVTALYKKHLKALAATPAAPITGVEKKAASIVVERLQFPVPFSLASIPHAERRPLRCEKALFALFDGERPLLDCIRMVDAEADKQTSNKEITTIIEQLQYLEKYAYLRLVHSS